MKYLSVYILFAVYLLFFKFSILVYSQEQSPNLKFNYNELYNSIQNEYGIDQELINGI